MKKIIFGIALGATIWAGIAIGTSGDPKEISCEIEEVEETKSVIKNAWRSFVNWFNSDKTAKVWHEFDEYCITKSDFVKDHKDWQKKYNFLVKKKYKIQELAGDRAEKYRFDSISNDFGVLMLSGIETEILEERLIEVLKKIQNINSELDKILEKKQKTCESQRSKVKCPR